MDNCKDCTEIQRLKNKVDLLEERQYNFSMTLQSFKNDLSEIDIATANNIDEISKIKENQARTDERMQNIQESVQEVKNLIKELTLSVSEIKESLIINNITTGNVSQATNNIKDKLVGAGIAILGFLGIYFFNMFTGQ